MTGGYSVEEISLHDDGCEMLLTMRYMRMRGVDMDRLLMYWT